MLEQRVGFTASSWRGYHFWRTCQTSDQWLILVSSNVRFVLLPPVHNGPPDEDDLVTLRLAARYDGDYVDNDNFSDWLHRGDIEEELEVAIVHRD